MSLTKPDRAGLSRLVDEFDLDINRASLIWPFVVQMVAYAIEEGIKSGHHADCCVATRSNKPGSREINSGLSHSKKAE